MKNNYNWLIRKTYRSVDNLKLWAQNPRLNPENIYVTLKDFIEEIIYNDTEKDNFINLAKSIASRGFIPADPIVVWQNPENSKFYVAEGNRRILALKLLHNPNRAPRSIKGIFYRLSESMVEPIQKIPISIAPSFEDAEWYITQRHSVSSLQKRWSNEQQKRWIASLYEKYEGDITIIKPIIEISESELQSIIRTLKLKSLVNKLDSKLSPSDFEKAKSHTFPLTTLERFFTYTSVRNAWGIEFNEYDIKIANEPSFLNAYAELIKRMLLSRENELRIDSRTIHDITKVEHILKTLPTVDTTQIDQRQIDSPDVIEPSNNACSPNSDTSRTDEHPVTESEREKRLRLKNDIHRRKLICDFYIVRTDSAKINGLFNELKRISLSYNNIVSSAIRVMLDLSVKKYIETEKLEEEIRRRYSSSLRDVELSRRLEFLKTKVRAKNKTIVERLLNPANELSLDVLNGHVHSDTTVYSSPEFLNQFWDFIFPLIEELIVIQETPYE